MPTFAANAKAAKEVTYLVLPRTGKLCHKLACCVFLAW